MTYLWQSLFILFHYTCFLKCETLLDTDDYIVERKINRENPLFTQGLSFDEKGFIIESGGGYNGQSKLIKYDLESPNLKLASFNFSNADFLEGSTKVNNSIFILTWQQRIIYHFKDESSEKEHKINKGVPETIELPKEIHEGWGLTYDGEYLIISDGSNKIFFVDFSDLNSFKVVKTIVVKDNQGEDIKKLNELEYVDNIIFANVWMEKYIVLIDPQTGDVLRKIDFQKLVELESKNNNHMNLDSVLNGIAYSSTRKSFVITGKTWDYLYLVKFK